MLAAILSGCGNDDEADAKGGQSGSGGSAGSGRGGGAGASTGGAGTGGSAGSGGSSGPRGGAGGQGSMTDGGGELCPSLGWCELVNTQLLDVCPDPEEFPDIQGNEGCSGVIDDWSGGVQDETRSRLVIWGGGHGGYFGNELYALDLVTLTMMRLNEPSDVAGYDFNDCYAPDAYADGRPVSRHTYDALAYIAHADEVFSFSGAKAPCGYSNDDTWILDLASIATAPSGQAAPWELQNPTGPSPRANVGVVSDYDPNTQSVILDDGYSLLAYDVEVDSFALLNDSNATNAHIDYHMTGRVDPKRRLFIIVGGGDAEGGGMQVFDIGPGSDYAQQDWTDQVTGCDGLLSAIYPGFAYDPIQDKMVGWGGGDTVYLFDPDAKACTTVEYAGSPGDQNDNGTMGRFRYFESLNVFAVVNAHDQNAFTLRLTE